jgi:hypothetical protein
MTETRPEPSDHIPTPGETTGPIPSSATVDGETRAEWDAMKLREKGPEWMEANKGLLDSSWE